MLRNTSLYGFGHERLWRPAGVDFDGTNDYMDVQADLTGLADSAQGIVSFWLRLDGGDGARQVIFDMGGTCSVDRLAANTFQVDFRGSGRITMTTSGTYTSGATWRHVLASWDTSSAEHLYITDVSDKTGVTRTAGTIDYTNGESGWAASVSGAGGGSKLNGCLAECFFHTSYVDLSVTANRRKFITAAGTPEYLGKVGERPLGVQPLVYLSRRFGAPVNSFVTNRGTGGGYTLTGTLDPSSSNP